MADDTRLNLNCLVFGDDGNHIFLVKIAKSEIVCALREAIKSKKRPAFDHIPADALVLWKVSVLVDQSLTTTLYNRAFDDPLLPLDLLSDGFVVGCLLRPPCSKQTPYRGVSTDRWWSVRVAYGVDCY